MILHRIRPDGSPVSGDIQKVKGRAFIINVPLPRIAYKVNIPCDGQ
jgi:hypothetical protein